MQVTCAACVSSVWHRLLLVEHGSCSYSAASLACAPLPRASASGSGQNRIMRRYRCLWWETSRSRPQAAPGYLRKLELRMRKLKLYIPLPAARHRCVSHMLLHCSRDMQAPRGTEPGHGVVQYRAACAGHGRPRRRGAGAVQAHAVLGREGDGGVGRGAHGRGHRLWPPRDGPRDVAEHAARAAAADVGVRGRAPRCPAAPGVRPPRLSPPAPPW